MTVNGLSPESRLNGYAVVGKRQVKRIKELCEQLEAARGAHYDTLKKLEHFIEQALKGGE